jgi:hypothetical protein
VLGKCGVAVDVLGHAVQDDVCAKEERGLEEEREEGVVDEHERTGGVRVSERRDTRVPTKRAVGHDSGALLGVVGRARSALLGTSRTRH